MAIRPVSRRYYLPITKDQFTRNGLVPDWRVGAYTSKIVNHAVCHLRKVVYAKSLDPANIPSANSSTLTPFRFRCNTGAASTTSGIFRLRAHAAVLPSDNVGAGGVDGKWRLVINDGSDTASDYRNYPGVNTAPTMDDVAYQQVTVSASADTAYECRIEIVGARLLSVVVYEEHSPFIDTADTGSVCDDSLYSYGAEITDAQHANDFVTAPHNVWLKNGSHLWTLSPESEGGFWTATSATYKNMLNQLASTTVGDNTPGINTQVRYYNAAHTDNVVCTLAAYGYMSTGGATGNFQLKDLATGQLAELTWTGTTESWQTATLNLDGTVDTHKVDPQFHGDGTNTLTIEAVSLYVNG